MTQPLLSVIIPVYNTEKYLNECIQSVVNQTYANLEIILINDGSTDNSPAICDEWAKKDSRIRVIHKENGGAGDSRNAALDTVKSPLIGIVDSDDYILPDMYEKLYNAMIENDADLSICTLSLVDINDNVYPYKSAFSQSLKLISRDEAFNIYNDALEYDVLWTKLYKSEIFNDIRLLDNLHEDTAIIHRVIGKCNKIVLLNQALYIHLLNNSGITNILYQAKFNLREFQDRKFIAQDRYNYFMSINRPDLASESWRAAHYALAYILKRVNYFEYKHEISPFLGETICGLIKSCKFKYWIRALNLVRLFFCSIFRPYLHEEQTK